MPFYEYECRQCSHRFEELLAYAERETAEKKLVCPRCGSVGPRRLISTFAASASSPSGHAPHPGCGSGG